MHVDPLVVSARAVVDGTGHPSEIIRLATQKAGIRIDTPSGGLMGERPMERLLRLAFPLTTVVIGGINAENLPRILSRGAVNVAVVRAVCRASDPARAIDDLQGVWRRHANRLERLAILRRSR